MARDISFTDNEIAAMILAAALKEHGGQLHIGKEVFENIPNDFRVGMYKDEDGCVNVVLKETTLDQSDTDS